LGAAVAATLGIAGTPASAHPFGPPSAADVSVSGDRVSLVWQAAEDDWVALGQSVGAFEDPTQGSVDTTVTGEQKLQRSTAVRDYLLGNIRVSQAGQDCAGTLLPLEQLLTEGARLRFDCPRPVTELRLTVTTLTDLNPAYRTVATGRATSPGQVLFTATGASHDLRVTATGGGTPGAVTWVAAGTGLAAAGALAVFLIRRRTGVRR
ncbi:hypothetical protein ABT336_26675, partial [Micromonospora sp. NPDC000207]|uniref:hypothetical protein n=1 Tax=Micromonospora sp. NPDC000207 TaxID=3154246 RepID=UPI003327155B